MSNPPLWKPRTLNYRLFIFIFSIFTLSLTSCSTVESVIEPPPTILELKFETSSDLNLNPEGKATPLVARFYELKTADGFSNADFFALYNQDKDILGSDIVFRKELELIPANTQELKVQAKKESRFIGVFGAFRDLETAQWRAVVEIPSNKTTVMTVHFSKNSVSIEVPNDEPSTDAQPSE